LRRIEAAMLRWSGWPRETMPSTTFTIELVRVEELDGQVVASMRQRGRGKASGAEVHDRLTHVRTLRDGHIATSNHASHKLVASRD
jgi:hypothetical protein